MKHRVYLGLGSNLGDRQRWLQFACAYLSRQQGIELLRTSSVYQTAPWGVTDQEDYYNAVAELDTTLSPHELLDITQRAEELSGRQRLYHWAPRPLDIDMLLFDDLVIADERLTVPHPLMGQRLFVLAPLAELVGNISIPGCGELQTLLAAIDKNQSAQLLTTATAWIRGVNNENY